MVIGTGLLRFRLKSVLNSSDCKLVAVAQKLEEISAINLATCVSSERPKYL